MKRRILSCLILVLFLAVLSQLSGAGQSTPRRQPGADITLYAPEQHDLYDGHFVLSASRVYQVAGLHDAAGWNHMSNDASAIHPVKVLWMSMWMRSRTREALWRVWILQKAS